jgi:hypothetical protein
VTPNGIGHDDCPPDAAQFIGHGWIVSAQWVLAANLVDIDSEAFLQSIGQFCDQQSKVLIGLGIVKLV